jgi:hypothetical protein
MAHAHDYDPSHADAPRDQRRIAMAASLVVAVLMLVGKLTAFVITGSTAILSDALESVIHLFATGIAAVGLWYAAQPPDSAHPYGHGKIAYFSSAFEGLLILVAAMGSSCVSGRACHRAGAAAASAWASSSRGCSRRSTPRSGWLIRVGKRHNAHRARRQRAARAHGHVDEPRRARRRRARVVDRGPVAGPGRGAPRRLNIIWTSDPADAAARTTG